MIAIVSDIHGNYPALKAVLEEISTYPVERIISLGDVAGYYCYINECINLCREYDIINILGNHDYYLISGNGCPRSYSANVCLKYQMDSISKENRKWLEDSITLYDEKSISLRHGGWADPLDEYLYDFSFDMIKGYNQRIFGSGHTHIQKLVESEWKIYFNPGSVGQPRDYDARAAYALINDDGSVTLKRCAYPIEETIEEMRRRGFQERIYDCLRYGSKIGEILR